MRLEQLTLQIAGDDLTLTFHDRLTVVSGIGGDERRELIEHARGRPRRWARAAHRAALRRRHRHAGAGRQRRRRRRPPRRRRRARPSPTSRACSASTPTACAGSPTSPRPTSACWRPTSACPSRPSCAEARQTLAALTEEVENAELARDTAEALRARARGSSRSACARSQEGEAKRRYARLLGAARAGAGRGRRHPRRRARRPTPHKRLVARRPGRPIAWPSAGGGPPRGWPTRDRSVRRPRAPRPPDALRGRSRRPTPSARATSTRWSRPTSGRGRAVPSSRPSSRTGPSPTCPSRRTPPSCGSGACTRTWCGRRRTPRSTPAAGVDEASLALGGLEADGGTADAAADLELAHDAVEDAEQLAEKRRTPALVFGRLRRRRAVGFVHARCPPSRRCRCSRRPPPTGRAPSCPRRRSSRPNGPRPRCSSATASPRTSPSTSAASRRPSSPRPGRPSRSRPTSTAGPCTDWTEIAGDELTPDDALALEDEVRRTRTHSCHLEGSGAAVEDTPQAARRGGRARASSGPAASSCGRASPSASTTSPSPQDGAPPGRRRHDGPAAEGLGEGRGRRGQRHRREARGPAGRARLRRGRPRRPASAASTGPSPVPRSACAPVRSPARLAEVEVELAELEARARHEARPEWDAKVSPADAEEPDFAELEARRDDATLRVQRGVRGSCPTCSASPTAGAPSSAGSRCSRAGQRLLGRHHPGDGTGDRAPAAGPPGGGPPPRIARRDGAAARRRGTPPSAQRGQVGHARHDRALRRTRCR